MKQMMSAIRKATRVMLTGGLLAALAAAGTGCERRESGTAGADVKPQRGQAGQQVEKAPHSSRRARRVSRGSRAPRGSSSSRPRRSAIRW